MWSVNVMYTACPACKTVYPVSAAQLRAAGGRVHCGNCDKIFDATPALFDDPQQAFAFAEQQLREVSREIDDLVGRALDEVSATETAGPPADVQLSQEPGADTQATETPAETVDPFEPGSRAADLAGIVADKRDVQARSDRDIYANPVAAEFVTAQAAPEPRAQQQPVSPLLFETDAGGARTSWGAIAAALLLTVVLIGQYVWVERYRLAAIPELRPYLETACAILGCDLPLRHDTAKLEILEREIRNHPHVGDALLVSVTFVNGADFRQRYPIFEVTFSDVSGTPVAMRRFRPEEYLDDVDPAMGMAPGQQTRVMLEIVDPGNRAVSFQFDFL